MTRNANGRINARKKKARNSPGSRIGFDHDDSYEPSDFFSETAIFEEYADGKLDGIPVFNTLT